jgi:hypothetical protein
MAKFHIVETTHKHNVYTVRLGATGAGNQYDYAEIGKAVKLSASDTYTLCATGNAIEGIVISSNYPEQGTVDGYSIGGIVTKGYKSVTFDGLQATPGTGTIAAGDYVVTGSVSAKGTALPGPLKVVKATDQDAAKAAPFKARVVSLGVAGTGAVGTVGTIEIL